MNIACPVCNSVFPLESALTDSAARDAVAAALRLPAPLGERLLRYLGLFRPATRALSWERVAKLLNELLDPISQGRVERNGRTWVAPIGYWEIALDDMLAKRDKLQLPLKSHGYLFEIVAGLANKAEGHTEQRAIERASTPYRVLNEKSDEPADPRVTKAAIDTLKSLTGKKPVARQGSEIPDA